MEILHNENFVPYFSMEEYINKIKLTDRVLFHLEDTNVNFDKYIKTLMKYDNQTIIRMWLDSLRSELKYSYRLENKEIAFQEKIPGEFYFDKLTMSHNRIKEMHNFVMACEKGIPIEEYNEDYRKKGSEVKVSTCDYNGNEIIFWRGANGEDVKKFMDDFLKIYNENSMSQINSNPFLKSFLLSFLFLRIHPFIDGNGRTSRLIFNIKFTEFVNKLFGTNLRMSPLNISGNILLYKKGYVDIIDSTYFDLDHDVNEEINALFDFMLNRVDESLFYYSNKIDGLDKNFEQDKNFYERLSQDAKVMKLEKVRKNIK